MDMIFDALKVMLFGMIGIFFVMGLLILSTKVLELFGKDEEDEPQEDSED